MIGERVAISIVNPPSPPDTVSNKDTMGGLGQLYPRDARDKMPPIDIPYAAALIRNEGIPCQVIDCLGSGYDVIDLIVRLSDSRPEFTALRTSTPSYAWDMRVARLIKMSVPTTVVMFGPHAALFPAETLREDYIDAVVVGEPELVLPDIARMRCLDRCKGIFYKQQGTVVKTEPVQRISELDRLPFPAWDMMPYHAYDGGDLMRNITPFVTVLSSRGCPHSCLYCPYPVTQGRKLRERTADNVVNELRWLTSSLGVRAVLFRDPEFAYSRDRVVNICEGILRQDIKLAWRCETRIENLDNELIGLMARAGCIGINMAIESADEFILAALNRKVIDLRAARKVVGACARNGIESFCFFILGLPGETLETAHKTISYAKRLAPNFVQFTLCTPYPGTELWRRAEKQDMIGALSISHFTSYAPIMPTEQLSLEDLQKLQQFANGMRDMSVRKVAARIVRHVRIIASDIVRAIMYVYEGWKYSKQARWTK